MFFRAKSNTIQLKTGQTVPLNGPLVSGMKRPATGWTVRFRLNGVDKVVHGNNPQAVGNRARETLKQADVTFTEADLWLNLNLQWMEKMEHRNFKVDHAKLAALVQTEGVSEAPTQRKTFTPEQWGSIAWKWLGLYLAQDNYNPEDFLRQLETVLVMLSPSSNPTIGCIRCFSEWSAVMANTRHNMPKTLEEARKWLWQEHNKVSGRLGKRQLSFEEAQRANLWT